jgi:hypothetical protein
LSYIGKSPIDTSDYDRQQVHPGLDKAERGAEREWPRAVLAFNFQNHALLLHHRRRLPCLPTFHSSTYEPKVSTLLYVGGYSTSGREQVSPVCSAASSAQRGGLLYLQSSILLLTLIHIIPAAVVTG